MWILFEMETKKRRTKIDDILAVCIHEFDDGKIAISFLYWILKVKMVSKI